MVGWVKEWLYPDLDEKVEEAIDNGNMMVVRVISLAVVMIELFALVISVLVEIQKLHLIGTLIATGLCVAICLIVFLLSHVYMTGRKRSHGYALFTSWLFLVTITMIALYTSFQNYLQGRQMIFVFIVALSFGCFVHLKPICLIVFYLIEFLFFYQFLYVAHNDSEVDILLMNYVIFVASLCLVVIFGFRKEYKLCMSIVETEALTKRLETTSLHDQLTGLRNRHALDRALDVCSGTDWMVAMADVDRFKRFNDTYGHLNGDEVLRQVANGLASEFRAEDCYRYGGDEFLVVTSGFSQDEFKHRLKAWRDSVNAIRIKGVEEIIDISYGIQCGYVEDKEALFELISRADKQLYEVKAAKMLQR